MRNVNCTDEAVYTEDIQYGVAGKGRLWCIRRRECECSLWGWLVSAITAIVAVRCKGVKINVMQFYEGGRVNVINYLCS